MRSFYWTRLAFSLGILWSASIAIAQDGSYASPSLLPMPQGGPQFQGYTTDQTAVQASALVNSPYSHALYRHQPEAVPPAPGQQDLGQIPPPPPPGAMPPAGGVPVPPPAKGNCAGSCGNCAAANDYDAAMCSGWCNDCCAPGGCGQWFGSFAGLVLTRDNANPFWTTYETNNNPNQLMNTKDADADWAGGGEVRVGRWGCCDCTGRHGIEFSYFGVSPMNGYASLRDPANNLSTPIDLNTQTGIFDIGLRPAADFFDNAREHRITRSDEIHNVEINMLRQTLVSNNRTQVTWIAGARWFRFDDRLVFGSVAGANALTPNAEFGNNGGVDEAYLNIRCQNNLIGFQLGVRGDYYLTEKLGLYVTPKFGIYANDINTRSQLYAGDGTVAFDIRSNEAHFSLLAQLDAGGSYQLNNNWRAFAGYRVIGVTNVALTDNQIPAFIAADDEFADVDTNGSLIVHGALTGLECRF